MKIISIITYRLCIVISNNTGTEKEAGIKKDAENL